MKNSWIRKSNFFGCSWLILQEYFVQALQTKACKAISVMFSEESGEASMSINSELSRKRSGTHMDMAVLMPVKRLQLSQSLVHVSPPGMTSSFPLTSPQPSCIGKLCYVKT